MNLIQNFAEFLIVFFSGFSIGIVLFIILGYVFVKNGKSLNDLNP